MGTRFEELRGLIPDARLQLARSGTRVVFGAPSARTPSSNPTSPVASPGARVGRPDTFSSNNLTSLARLATAVEARHAAVAPALETCRQRMIRAEAWLGIARRVTPPASHPGPRTAAWETARVNLEKTEAELVALRDVAAIDLHFGLNAEVRSNYWKLVEAFRQMAGTARVWHASPTFSTEDTVRPTARSTTRSAIGGRALEPRPTRFAVEPAPLFRCRLPAMGFGTANGAELFLMPGFMVVHQPGVNLALIDTKDLSIQFSPLPDMQGAIAFESKSGFYERFVVDDWRALEDFRRATEVFQRSVAREKRQADGEATALLDVAIPDLTLPELPTLPSALPLDFRWQLPRWQMPRLQLPRLQLPHWQIPRLKMPRWQLPGWQLPHWQLSRWQMPRGQMAGWQFPRLQLPSWRLPSWRQPRVQFPRVQFPRLQFPRVQFPRVQLPTWRLPSWQLPRLQMPSWQLPRLQLPAWQMPSWRSPPAFRRQFRWRPEISIRMATATAAFCFGIVAAALVFRTGASGVQETAVAAPAQAVASADAKPATPTPVAVATTMASFVTGAEPAPATGGATAVPASFTSPSAASATAALPAPALAERRAHPPMLSVGAQPLTTAEIERLQSKLRALQYYRGSINGTLTERTVKAFNEWRSETSRPKSPTLDRQEYTTFLAAISR